MKIIGLTGGIGTGKSTVSKLLKIKGYEVIDADAVARDVVQVGKPAYQKIVKHFGEKILNADKSIDRAKLGEIVFSDKAERQLLNHFTHPPIRQAIFLNIAKHFITGKSIIFLDIPLLFETGQYARICSSVVVVNTCEKKQISRLLERDELSKEDIMKRIESQMPIENKVGLADHVIDNNGSQYELRENVDAFLVKVKPNFWQANFYKIALGTVAATLGFLYLSK